MVSNGIKKGTICIDYDLASEAIGRPSVFIEDGIYKMYYSYRKITDYRMNDFQSYKIGYAESSDGIKWEKMNDSPVLAKSENEVDWDYAMNEYCHVFFNKGKKIMLYNGNGFGKSGIGYAVYE